MKVLFLTAETAPFAKAGGLADVAAALPEALRRLGHDVRVIMPRYGTVDPERWVLTRRGEGFRFPAGHETIAASLLAADGPHGTVEFVEIPWLFGERHTMYRHGDDPRRFVLFTAAALTAASVDGWKPDVVHAHDWHTAIAPAMLKAGRAGPFFLDTASVLTIHNLAYQGWVHRPALDGAAAFLPDWVRDDWINLFGVGLDCAERVTTVSPTYAREIFTPEYGEGLDGLLRWRGERVHGILNGLDTELYDPARDAAIAAPFSANHPSPKSTCKAALQAEGGLEPRSDVPLIGMVSRLVDQKGFDLVAAAAEGLLESGDWQLAVLGTGEGHYHQLLEWLRGRFPGRMAAWLTFDDALARRIYAGADLFLMPSRFEPCGLGQLIAMRYGAVPVVRGTGGLADTVHEGPPDEPGTGFVFWEYDPGKLCEALDRALAAYRRQDEWRALMRNGMLRDSSWTAAAAEYARVYEYAVNDRRGLW